MKQTGYILLAVMILAFVSCGQSNKSKDGKIDEQAKSVIDKPGKVVIGAPSVIRPVLTAYASYFTQENPKAIIEVITLSEDSITKALENGKIGAGVFTGQISETGYKQGFVASDAMVCVINFNNPVLQKIVMYGLGTEQMNNLLTGKINFWEQLYKTNKKVPVKFYLPEENNPISKAVLAYYKPEGKVTASFLPSESDVLQSILNNEIGIGFISSSMAFDPKTGIKRDNLYIVPLDVNNNELADDNELIYDEMKKLEKNLGNKSFPTSFQRRFYLRYKSSNEQAYISEALLGWIEKNGYNFASKNGFFMNK